MNLPLLPVWLKWQRQQTGWGGGVAWRQRLGVLPSLHLATWLSLLFKRLWNEHRDPKDLQVAHLSLVSFHRESVDTALRLGFFSWTSRILDYFHEEYIPCGIFIGVAFSDLKSFRQQIVPCHKSKGVAVMKYACKNIISIKLYVYTYIFIYTLGVWMLNSSVMSDSLRSHGM